MRLLYISTLGILTFTMFSLYFEDIILSVYVFVVTKTYSAYTMCFLLKSRAHLEIHGITLSLMLAFATALFRSLSIKTIEEKGDNYQLKHREFCLSR